MIIEGTTQIIDSGVSNSSAVRSLAEDEAVVPKDTLGMVEDLETDVARYSFSPFQTRNIRGRIHRSGWWRSRRSSGRLWERQLPKYTLHAGGKLCSTHTHRKYRLSSLAQQLAPPESSAGAGTPTTAMHVSELALAEADVAYQKVKQERQGVCGARNRRAPV